MCAQAETEWTKRRVDREEGDKAVLYASDHPDISLLIFVKNETKWGQRNKACDSEKMFVPRLISQLAQTDVLKKLPELKTIVQCSEKDGLIQLNPQRRYLPALTAQLHLMSFVELTIYH